MKKTRRSALAALMVREADTVPRASAGLPCALDMPLRHCVAARTRRIALPHAAEDALLGGKGALALILDHSFSAAAVRIRFLRPHVAAAAAASLGGGRVPHCVCYLAAVQHAAPCVPVPSLLPPCVLNMAGMRG